MKAQGFKTRIFNLYHYHLRHSPPPPVTKVLVGQYERARLLPLILHRVRARSHAPLPKKKLFPSPSDTLGPCRGHKNFSEPQTSHLQLKGSFSIKFEFILLSWALTGNFATMRQCPMLFNCRVVDDAKKMCFNKRQYSVLSILSVYCYLKRRSWHSPSLADKRRDTSKGANVGQRVEGSTEQRGLKELRGDREGEGFWWARCRVAGLVKCYSDFGAIHSFL